VRAGAECPRTDDVAAYALGALGPGAEAEMTAHIEGCARCSAELRRLGPAVETLPESVEQIAPPPQVRERLLAAVHEEAGGAEAEKDRRRVGWRDRRLRIGGLAFGPATALAAALIVVAALVGYSVRQGGDQTRTVAVSSTLPGSSASLELSGDQATLHADGVPQLPPGSVYQLWVQRNGAVTPSSVFRPSADGSAAAAVPEALRGADAVLVTRERSRGVSAPTTRPVYSASLD
jgi:anti-sigma factor RsiW